MWQRAIISSGGGTGIKAAKGIIKADDWNGTSTSSTVSVTGLGFKPSHVSIFGGGTNKIAYVYDENVSAVNYSGTQGSSAVNLKPMATNTYFGQFSSINADGFTLIRYSSAGYTNGDIYWAAVE